MSMNMRRWPLKFDKRAACEYHEQDPCKIVGVRALLHSAKGLPRPSHRVAHSRKIVKNEDDFFGRLPPEIREEIAAYLPTADFYNLRYVSRMISAIFQVRHSGQLDSKSTEIAASYPILKQDAGAGKHLEEIGNVHATALTRQISVMD